MKTIVFVHGMFQNAKSWAQWVAYFESRGYRCIAENWPMHEGDPSALRANPPAGLGELGLPDVVSHFERIAMQAAQGGEKPIIIGHSVGGLVAQKLSAMGLASAAVAISSVAPNRMITFDMGLMKNTLAITNPLMGDKIFEMDADGFYANFGNAMDRAASDEAWERTATHDSRNVFRDCLLGPGEIDDMDAPHPPMLFIGGEKDEIIPPELNEKNAKAYKDENSAVVFQEFPNRGHFICGQPGWEEVAGFAADFLERSVPGAAQA